MYLPSVSTSAPSTSPPSGDVIVHVFGCTDVGRTREVNEDAFLVADLSTRNASLDPEVRTHHVGPRGTLFMVADGLGGAAVSVRTEDEVRVARLNERAGDGVDDLRRQRPLNERDWWKRWGGV